MNLLGDTLEKIAYEKAGIIKSNIPAIVGEKHPDTTPVFERTASAENAPLYFASAERFVAEWRMEKHELVAGVTTIHNNEKAFYRLDLTGIYQVKNLVTVLGTMHRLIQKGWKITQGHIEKGLQQVKSSTGLHGRWETIHENPTVILDVGHNEDGIRQLVQQVELTDHEGLHIVIGIVKDKEIVKILALLPKHANYYFTRAQIPRALPEDELGKQAANAGLHGGTYPEVNKALQAAMANAGKKDLIVVCGSVFIVGEVVL
jgi:dihydrofolate synthase/folylpolyglutamate synthase